MNKPLSHKITLAQLDVVDQHITSATGMPNTAYTDPAFFSFERDHILGTGWAALVFCVDYEENQWQVGLSIPQLDLRPQREALRDPTYRRLRHASRRRFLHAKPRLKRSTFSLLAGNFIYQLVRRCRSI